MESVMLSGTPDALAELIAGARTMAVDKRLISPAAKAMITELADSLEAFHAKPVVGVSEERSKFRTIGENWSTAGRLEVPLAMGPRMSDAAKERLRKLEELDAVALIEACKYPMGGRFKYHDEEGEHDPAYVVIPGGEMVPINGYDDGDASIPTDVARAAFIVTACNAALQSPLPVVSGEAIEQGARRLAKFYHPNADLDAGSPPLWFSYLGEANAVLQGTPVVEEGRREAETIARIISPDAWNASEGSLRWQEDEGVRAYALRRADQIILALTPVEGVGERMSEPSDSIVAVARNILVETVRKAEARSRGDKSYFAGVAEDIERAQPAKIDSWLALDALIAALAIRDTETLDAIAAMMGEFVDNWPAPRKVPTALALISKTMRAALSTPATAQGDVREAQGRIVTDSADGLCEDCPPAGYPTDKTRCAPCPRRATLKGQDNG